MGITNKELGRYDDALKYYSRALEIYKKKYGENHSYGMFFIIFCYI